jgi:hypothetical protein
MAKRKTTAKELPPREESNGYKGVHREKDSIREEKIHIDKTKNDQNAALHRYVL